MKFKKCVFCNILAPTMPYHITEVNHGKVEAFDMCKRCGTTYMEEVNKDLEKQAKKEKSVDLQEIKTPDQLLSVIFGMNNIPSKKNPCECGMTADEFRKYGRFGCSKCYDYFQEEFEKLVVPYHGNDAHVGKRPQTHRPPETPEEHLKTLRLKLAKAVETENYEAASRLKEELQEMERT